MSLRTAAALGALLVALPLAVAQAGPSATTVAGPGAPGAAPRRAPYPPPSRPSGPRKTSAGTSSSRAVCLPAGTPAPPRPAGAPGPYRCPLPGPVVDVFDAPATRYSPGHRGIDLRAQTGEEVRSPAAGQVSFAGMVAGRPVITVDHGGGWRSSLEPVRTSVAAGTLVTAGTPLGTVSAEPGHCAPATCVHLGVRHGEVYVDPTSLLGSARVVLLPLAR